MLCHGTELFIPATTGARDRTDDKMTALHRNLHFVAKLDLINKRFWYTDAA
jgi:hypothetical protein